MSEQAHLVLADGTAFEGVSFGARGVTTGEAVFTTTMTGYQEVLTDPSYTGQIVVMTAAEIGNTGVNSEDVEAVDGKPRVAGFVVRDASPIASSWRSESTLGAWLEKNGIVSIADIDTRRLTRHLRDHGSQNAAIGTESVHTLHDRAKNAPDMNGLDLVQTVTPKQNYAWSEGRGVWRTSSLGGPPKPAEHHVVVLDFGIKRNILRCLVDAGCRVTG
ncbi:MAG: carbamoyl-phosphate synthase domain-containing protein, partial [Polyangiaceae bacterium]